MSPVELYDVTRGYWKIGKDRAKARYALAIYQGIVREVYEIKQWFPAGTTFSSHPDRVRDSDEEWESDRWEFIGALAHRKIRRKYVGKSVAHYFPKSAQSPFIYVNIE